MERETAYQSPLEFARLNGLSIATVRRYLKSGRLPKAQPGGRGCRVLIPSDAIDVIKTSDSPVADEVIVSPTIDTNPESETPIETPSQPPGRSPKWMERR